MVKYKNYAHTEEEEVRAFFETHDVDDDGEISVYEFLLTKYTGALHFRTFSKAQMNDDNDDDEFNFNFCERVSNFVENSVFPLVFQ